MIRRASQYVAAVPFAGTKPGNFANSRGGPAPPPLRDARGANSNVETAATACKQADDDYTSYSWQEVRLCDLYMARRAGGVSPLSSLTTDV